ncbi:hypothetical protein DICVIV_00464 [Dictyocaulus viviparus]|uniref:Ankyrin repeat protein n=1 Tax=Dictyocaulus viviparus TaxID=29172 RepID=A0A0D8YFB8_DICVI|nr:hypothetical protein DICVIV_00464 [Dictyocaulus viviparus]
MYLFLYLGSGALLEATRSDAIRIVNFLHDRGAVDTDNRALRLAVKNKNFKLVRVFLTRLVFPDPEFKVNKKNVDVGQVKVYFHSSYKPIECNNIIEYDILSPSESLPIHVGSNLLPSSLCPSRAAMLNWSSASLRVLQSDWFIAAALQINPRLRTTKCAP